MTKMLRKIRGWYEAYQSHRACQRGDHPWKMVVDERHLGGDLIDSSGHLSKSPTVWDPKFPARRCVFECPRCGATEEFYRWAFLEGSGALTHFFGRDWRYTRDTVDCRPGACDTYVSRSHHE